MSDFYREPKVELHRTMVELIGGCRLVMGPALSSKRNYDIKDMLVDFKINCFVNLTPDRPNGKSRWYMNSKRTTVIEKLKEYVNEKGPSARCISFPMDGEAPVKDQKLFQFITHLCNLLKKNPNVRMYIHDQHGTHVAASVALPLWYFMKSAKEKSPTNGVQFDPIKAMKRIGKHQIIPDRKKAFVQQIRRMCEMDNKSIHRHIFSSSSRPPKKKARTENETKKDTCFIAGPNVSHLTKEQIRTRKSTFTLPKEINKL